MTCAGVGTVMLGLAFGGCAADAPLVPIDTDRVQGSFLYRGDFDTPLDSVDFFHGGELNLPPHGQSTGGTFRLVTCERMCPQDSGITGRMEDLMLTARDSSTYDIRFDLVRAASPYPFMRHKGLAKWGEMVGSWVRLDEMTGDTLAAGTFLGYLAARRR